MVRKCQKLLMTTVCGSYRHGAIREFSPLTTEPGFKTKPPAVTSKVVKWITLSLFLINAMFWFGILERRKTQPLHFNCNH